MSEVQSLVANTIVWSIVVAIVKIVGDADLLVGQVGKNGLLAQFGCRSRVQGRSQRSGHRRLDGFLLLADSFRVGVERLGGGLGRAALRGQAPGFRAEGRLVLSALGRVCRVSHDKGRIPPHAIQVYPTTSAYLMLSSDHCGRAIELYNQRFH